jgi:hypothetical protein
MFNLLKRPFGQYDNNGLKYPVSYLNKIEKEIAFYPLHEQAKYVDQVCYQNAKNIFFLEEQFSNFDPYDTSQYDGFNATSVGNMAYLALYAPSYEIRMKCMQALANYKAYLRLNKGH